MKLLPYLVCLAVAGQQVLAVPYNTGGDSQEIVAQGQPPHLTHPGASMLDILAKLGLGACATKFGTDPASPPPFSPKILPAFHRSHYSPFSGSRWEADTTSNLTEPCANYYLECCKTFTKYTLCSKCPGESKRICHSTDCRADFAEMKTLGITAK